MSFFILCVSNEASYDLNRFCWFKEKNKKIERRLIEYYLHWTFVHFVVVVFGSFVCMFRVSWPVPGVEHQITIPNKLYTSIIFTIALVYLFVFTTRACPRARRAICMYVVNRCAAITLPSIPFVRSFVCWPKTYSSMHDFNQPKIAYISTAFGRFARL